MVCERVAITRGASEKSRMQEHDRKNWSLRKGAPTLQRRTSLAEASSVHPNSQGPSGRRSEKLSPDAKKSYWLASTPHRHSPSRAARAPRQTRSAQVET